MGNIPKNMRAKFPMIANKTVGVCFRTNIKYFVFFVFKNEPKIQKFQKKSLIFVSTIPKNTCQKLRNIENHKIFKKTPKITNNSMGTIS